MGATPSGACLPEGPTAGRPTAPRLQPRHGRPARVLRPPARAAPLSPGPTTAEDPPPWLFGYFPNSGMASPREPGVESPVSGPGPTAGGKSAARPERAGHNPLPRFRPGAAVVRNPVPGGLVISLNIGLASRGQPGSLRTAIRHLRGFARCSARAAAPQPSKDGDPGTDHAAAADSFVSAPTAPERGEQLSACLDGHFAKWRPGAKGRAAPTSIGGPAPSRIGPPSRPGLPDHHPQPTLVQSHPGLAIRLRPSAAPPSTPRNRGEEP